MRLRHRTGQLGRDETEHAGVLGIELAVEAARANDNAAVVDIKHDAVDYHKKAAENYGEAAKNYGELARLATKVGNKRDAVDYHEKEKEANQKAAEERHLQFQLTLTSLAVRHDEAVAVPTSRTGPVQKAAEVRDASPAFNDPRNKL